MFLPAHSKAFSLALGAVCLCVIAAGGEPIDARVADDMPNAALKESSVRAITSAIVPSEKSRETILQRTVTVSFGEAGPEPVVIRVADHPEWIVFDETYGYIADERAVRQYLDENPELIAPAASQAVAANVRPHGQVIRADIAGVPVAGYSYDSAAAARSIVQALYYNDPDVTVALNTEDPVLYLRTASGVRVLERLSSGRSDFAGSPYGRRANVLKALHERLQGIVIEPGEDFSFAGAMAGAVGWSDALVIVNGGELVSEPGGGICQTATTALRAAMLAGLPVPKRANHSLYVTYYEAFGVGIDATYYPGKQDLTFTNDTGNTIVVLARDDGDHAIVELYGVPDGRTVALDGPYIGNAGDDDMDGRTLRINQIGWNYDVTYPDGRIERDQLVSTYRALPRTLGERFPVRRGLEELVSAATGSQIVTVAAHR